MDSNQDISDEDFRKILTSLSGWYDRHGYLNMLKVLYSNLVAEPDKLYAANKVIEVFELLCTSGHLNFAYLAVLYDTINITQPFGLEPEIRKFSMTTLLDIRTIRVSKFTGNRQTFMKVVKSLSDNDVRKISQLYSYPQQYDRWKLFVDLEQTGKISERTLDDFMKNLTTCLIRDSNKDPLGLRRTCKMGGAPREPNTRTSIPSNRHMLISEPNKSVEVDDKRTAGMEKLVVTGDIDVGSRETVPEKPIVTGDVDVGTRAANPDELMEYGDIDVGAKEAGPEELIKTGNADIGARAAGLEVACNVDVGAVGPGKLMELGDVDAGPALSIQDFEMLKLVFSQWYDRHRNLPILKVLFRDYVDNYELPKVKSTIDLLNILIKRGALSSKKIGILCDTIRIMKHFDLQNIIEEKLPSFPNAKERIISSFTDYRQKIIAFGVKLTADDIRTIDARYNTPLKNYTDSWEMISDLENNLIISEKKMEKFTDILRKLNLSGALHALTKGNHEASTANGNQEASTANGNQEALNAHDVIIRKYLQKRQQTLLKRAHLLTPPTWNSQFKIDLSHMFMDLVLLKDNRKEKDMRKDKVKETEPCTLKELLHDVRTIDSCKVLVEGDGGMGKTTLLKRIAYDYAIQQNDETFKEKIVFFINIRDIKEAEDLLDAILKQINLKHFNRNTKLKLKSTDEIQDFILNHDDDIVLLLDGYDELEASAEDAKDQILSIFQKIELEGCKLILTSRSGKLAEFIKSCDVHVKVEGFDKNNSKEFIKRFFATYSKKKLGKLLTRKIFQTSYSQKEYDYYSFVFEGCRTPMLLLHICIIWRDRECLPDSNAELFQEIFKCILNQFKRSCDDKEKFSEFADISREFINAMLLLGKYVYRNLKQNKLYITENELKGNKDEIEFALKLGFVNKDSPISEHHFKMIYTTPHKLLSEALAGFYLCNAVQLGSFSNEEWEELRSNEYLQNTHVFAIGFLGKDAFKLLKNWITIKETCFGGLAKYFVHVKKEDEENILMLLDKHLNNFFEIRTLTNMSKSLRQFIAYCSSNKTVTFNSRWKYSSNSVLSKDPRQRFAYHSKAEPNRKDHFIKLICEIINSRQINVCDIVDWILSLSNSEKNIGRMVVHVSVAFLYHRNILQRVLELIPDMVMVESILSECKKLRFVFKIDAFKLVHKPVANASFLNLLLHLPKLYTLELEDCNLTGAILKEAIDVLWQTSEREVCLSLTILSLSNNNLSDISGHSLAQLFTLAPKLKSVHFAKCSLTGLLVERFLAECNKLNTDLKCCVIDFRYNNLSEMDVMKLLDGPLNVNEQIFTWRDYHLSAGNLQYVLQTCHENSNTFEFQTLDLSDTNLSELKISVLSLIWKVFPKCKYFNMSTCSLSGTSVRALMSECKPNGGALGYDMICLEGNDLSDMDSMSLANYLHTREFFLWSSCCLSADNLHSLIHHCFGNGTICHIAKLSFSKTNLSKISASTLALMWKVFPKLEYVSMNECSLSGVIVGDMLNECDQSNIDLKHVSIDLSNIDLKHASIDLSDNDLSDTDSISLAHELKCTTVNLSGMKLSEVNGAILALLWKIYQNQVHVNMRYCTLSSSIVLDLLEECEKNGIDLKYDMIDISYNNISDIDVLSLRKLINNEIIDSAIGWESYGLTANNLDDLIQACRRHDVTCSVDRLNLSKIDLSRVSVSTLALVWQVFPKCKLVDMSECTLSGRVIIDLMNECTRIGVDFNINTICLVGNDLSNIDSASLVKYIDIMKIMEKTPSDIEECRYTFSWNEYNLTSQNLEELINFCKSVGTTLELDTLRLTHVDLNALNGCSLAYISKLFPKLRTLEISKCNISSRMFSDFLIEWDKNVLEGGCQGCWFSLYDIDLSDIDSKSLAVLVKLQPSIHIFLNRLNLSLDKIQDLLCATFLKISEISKWNEYVKSAEKLQELINECDSSSTELLNCTKIDLEKMNLSEGNGKTLALLWNICPNLRVLNMRNCCLSAKIVAEILNECKENFGVDLRGVRVCLLENDLSDIDSSTLAYLIRLHRLHGSEVKSFCLEDYNLSADAVQHLLCAKFLKISGIANWHTYVKSDDKLHDLIFECDKCDIKLDCTMVSVNGIDLDDFNGETLALLWIICPKLNFVDMRNCDVSPEVVKDCLKACDKHGIGVHRDDSISFLIRNSDTSMKAYRLYLFGENIVHGSLLLMIQSLKAQQWCNVSQRRNPSISTE